jgi:hypothetical protein
MIRDGMADTQREGVKVKDVAELVADSMETKSPAPAASETKPPPAA